MRKILLCAAVFAAVLFSGCADPTDLGNRAITGVCAGEFNDERLQI